MESVRLVLREAPYKFEIPISKFEKVSIGIGFSNFVFLFSNLHRVFPDTTKLTLHIVRSNIDECAKESNRCHFFVNNPSRYVVSLQTPL